MNLKALLQLACVAVILFQAIVTYQPGPGPNPPGPPNPPVIPVVPDWPAPSAELQAAVAPVRLIMDAADQQKAAQWAAEWESYYTSMMDRTPLPTAAGFKSDIGQKMNAAAQRLNLAGAFPGFTAAMDAAFASYFGSEDSSLDWNRGKEFVSAIVWACK